MRRAGRAAASPCAAAGELLRRESVRRGRRRVRTLRRHSRRRGARVRLEAARGKRAEPAPLRASDRTPRADSGRPARLRRGGRCRGAVGGACGARTDRALSGGFRASRARVADGGRACARVLGSRRRGNQSGANRRHRGARSRARLPLACAPALPLAAAGRAGPSLAVPAALLRRPPAESHHVRAARPWRVPLRGRPALPRNAAIRRPRSAGALPPALGLGRRSCRTRTRPDLGRLWAGSAALAGGTLGAPREPLAGTPAQPLAERLGAQAGTRRRFRPRACLLPALDAGAGARAAHAHPAAAGRPAWRRRLAPGDPRRAADGARARLRTALQATVAPSAAARGGTALAAEGAQLRSGRCRDVARAPCP